MGPSQQLGAVPGTAEAVPGYEGIEPGNESIDGAELSSIHENFRSNYENFDIASKRTMKRKSLRKTLYFPSERFRCGARRSFCAPQQYWYSLVKSVKFPRQSIMKGFGIMTMRKQSLRTTSVPLCLSLSASGLGDC